MRLTLYDLSHLRYRNLIASPVEDGRIVVDVLNFDRDGADALQRGSTTIARLHNIRIMSNFSFKHTEYASFWRRYSRFRVTVQKHWLIPVLRIRDVNHPNPGSEFFPSRIPDPHQRMQVF
jgi:hypothetical protein